MGSALDRSKIPLRQISAAFLILFTVFLTSLSVAAVPSFRFHLKSEPHSLDPVTFTSGEGTYLFSNLYRGLTRYTDEGELVFDEAEKCKFKTPQIVTCKIRSEAKWSDGRPIAASDYIKSFLRLVSPGSSSYAAPLLFGIKNARNIFHGKVKSLAFGMTAVSDKEIQFELEVPDTEFFEKLSNPLLVPYREPTRDQDLTSLIVNGPYRVKEVIKGQKIVLEPNPSFVGGVAKRPIVEIYYANEDSTALTLYEKGVINFLWRVTTEEIPKYRDRPDFFQKPVARFDYVGFNLRPGGPFSDKSVRRALAQGLHYDDFKKMFFALGAMGCPSLGENLLPEDGHCLSFQQSAGVKLEKPLQFWFSQLGGDDIKRQALWLQEQWRKNVGIKMEIKGMDQKLYVDQLKKNPPDLFRKGIGLTYPSCVAGLEYFKTGHPENYIGFHNPRFDNLVAALSNKKLSRSERESICGAACDILFKEEYVAIPMGRMYFSMLASPKFKGWKVNDLNQLDLSKLEYVGDEK